MEEYDIWVMKNRLFAVMGCVDYKTRNVVHLATGFICVFFAFNSQGFIEPTVISNAAVEGQIDPNAGYYRYSSTLNF